MEQVEGSVVSVVVPTLDRARLLKGCLDSLSAHDFPRRAYEVVVVDGGSQDNTRAVVREAAKSRSGSCTS